MVILVDNGLVWLSSDSMQPSLVGLCFFFDYGNVGFVGSVVVIVGMTIFSLDILPLLKYTP